VTTTVTTSTSPTTSTLPSGCTALTAREAVVCLVDGPARRARRFRSPLAKKRDRAAGLVDRALARQRPKGRAKLFARAIATLEKARDPCGPLEAPGRTPAPTGSSRLRRGRGPRPDARRSN
jgi:hypothetical protein